MEDRGLSMVSDHDVIAVVSTESMSDSSNKINRPSESKLFKDSEVLEEELEWEEWDRKSSFLHHMVNALIMDAEWLQ